MKRVSITSVLSLMWCLVVASEKEPPWSSQDLQRRVNEAIARGATPTTIRIPSGDYYFFHSNFNIAFAENLSLVASSEGNVSLWFSGDSGVNITNSRSVRFQGSQGKSFIIIDYDPPPPPGPTFHETSGITLQLYNCSRVYVEDVIIRAAPFMAVTAYQGNGEHVFQRLHFQPLPDRNLAVVRDALHFSDLRQGPTVMHSNIGFSGDDFFNVHSTLLLVLECQRLVKETKLVCLLANPRVSTESPKNTIYGTFSVLPFVIPGDVISFYSWPHIDMVMKPLLSGAIVSTTEDVSSEFGDIAQALLPPMLEFPFNTNWHEATNQTTKFTANEVWRVQLEFPDHDSRFLKALPIGTIVTVDTIASAGAKLINNTFSVTHSNLGRFKSPGGVIQGNTFRQAWKANLELSALPQFLEGPIDVRDVVVQANLFSGFDTSPATTEIIHCGPLCERQECRGGGCHRCPPCTHDTAWARNITLCNNSIVSSRQFVFHLHGEQDW